MSGEAERRAPPPLVPPSALGPERPTSQLAPTVPLARDGAAAKGQRPRVRPVIPQYAQRLVARYGGVVRSDSIATGGRAVLLRRGAYQRICRSWSDEVSPRPEPAEGHLGRQGEEILVGCYGRLPIPAHWQMQWADLAESKHAPTIRPRVHLQAVDGLRAFRVPDGTFVDESSPDRGSCVRAPWQETPIKKPRRVTRPGVFQVPGSNAEEA